MAEESTHIFHYIAAAENAYRQQKQNINSLITKFDTFTETVNTLTSTISVLLSHLPEWESVKHTVSPFPSHWNCISESQIDECHKSINWDRSVELTSDHDDSNSDETTLSPLNHKGVTDVRLPKFHVKYTDNVHAWISIIEDQFQL